MLCSAAVFVGVRLLVYPVVQTPAISMPDQLTSMADYPSNIPCDFNGVELHSHCYDADLSRVPFNGNQDRQTEDCLPLPILKCRIRSQHGAKVIVVHGFLIFHHEVPPPLLALLALHLVLVDCFLWVKFWKLPSEMIIDLIVHSREP